MIPGEERREAVRECDEITGLARSLFAADAKMRAAIARCRSDALTVAGGPPPAEDDPRTANRPTNEIPAETAAALHALVLVGCAAALKRRLADAPAEASKEVDSFLVPMARRAADVLGLLHEGLRREDR